MIAVAWGGWVLAGCGGVVIVWLWRNRTKAGQRVDRACHELRGPLSVLRLGMELGARSGGLSRRRFRALEVELGRAAQAVDDLQGVRGVPEWVEVGSWLEDCVEAWRAAAGPRNLSVDLGDAGSAFVWGESRRLTQALANLVANAVEHGDGTVAVRAATAGDRLRIEVSDEGLGLPTALAALTARRVFPRWRWASRARSRAPASGRRGHGLQIVAEVIMTSGGRVLSAPSERGARIVVELPLASPAIAHANTGP